MTNTLQRPMNRSAMNAANAARRSEYKLADEQRTAAWQAHRTLIEGGVTVPTIRVPNRHVQLRLRGHCQFCRGSIFYPDLPSVAVERPDVAYRGTVRCGLCNRAIAALEIGERQPIVWTTCACGADAVYEETNECRACRTKRKSRESMRALRARKVAP